MITKIIACADLHIPSLTGINEVKDTLGKFIDEVYGIVDKEEGDPDNVRVVV